MKILPSSLISKNFEVRMRSILLLAILSLFIPLHSAAANSAVELSEAASAIFEKYTTFQDTCKQFLIGKGFSKDTASEIASLIPQSRNNANLNEYTISSSYIDGLCILVFEKCVKRGRLAVKFRVNDRTPKTIELKIYDILIANEGKIVFCDLIFVDQPDHSSVAKMEITDSKHVHNEYLKSLLNIILDVQYKT